MSAAFAIAVESINREMTNFFGDRKNFDFRSAESDPTLSSAVTRGKSASRMSPDTVSKIAMGDV